MKNTLFTKWLAAALWVLALGSTAALAEPDTFYLGDGHDGPFRASAESTVNSYAQVVSPLLAGDTEISVTACTASPCFAGGALVMVFQTTGFLGTPPPVEDPAPPTSLNSTEVGRWELARVESVTGTTLKLRAPLIRGYAAQVTQVIRVPEYTEVNVGPEDSIIAKPWDGKVGGVLAFLSTGNVRNLGMISADGMGFRGGVFVGDSGGSGSTGCSGEASAPKGAQKGEGIANTYHGPAIRDAATSSMAAVGGSASSLAEAEAPTMARAAWEGFLPPRMGAGTWEARRSAHSRLFAPQSVHSRRWRWRGSRQSGVRHAGGQRRWRDLHPCPLPLRRGKSARDGLLGLFQQHGGRGRRWSGWQHPPAPGHERGLW
ncbi:adventurous gliding motility protein AgmC [Cystobacter fuscus]